jgi:hypothetical protein
MQPWAESTTTHGWTDRKKAKMGRDKNQSRTRHGKIPLLLINKQTEKRIMMIKKSTAR